MKNVERMAECDELTMNDEAKPFFERGRWIDRRWPCASRSRASIERTSTKANSDAWSIKQWQLISFEINVMLKNKSNQNALLPDDFDFDIEIVVN